MRIAILVFLVPIFVLGLYVFFEPKEGGFVLESDTMIIEFTGGESVVIADGEYTPQEAILDLSGREYTRVPMEIFDNYEISILDLSDNEFTGALPAEVRSLQKLRVLDLSDNEFTGVPAEIGQLRMLEKLDLSNNPITGLPHELGRLQKLRVLNLQNTNYSSYDLSIIKRTLPEDVEIRL